ncbi:MAG: hypothetical protein CMD22_01805 [Flavobacteriales bacterium]|nr:hypothetical protein [Flavobacteriales bacterium]|tara:strand:- start:1068 stop:1826 length:759 start_codon:yes stop_codon:yes gene_type:complete
MKILLSPAKKLDFSNEKSSLKNTDYLFSEQSKEIMKELSNYSVLQLSKLMKLSDKLSILNKERNDSWTYPFSIDDAKQALFAFKGEVYQNIRVNEFSESELDLANKSIRIISGLYGVLSPSDLILPYRLEMGTKLSVSGHKNLYSFWKDILTKHLLSELKSENFLVNLASDEYFKVFDSKEITVPIVTPIFKDIKNGKLKVISFFAKRARGAMCNYIIKNKINTIEDIKLFNWSNYILSEDESTENKLIFIR